MALFVNIFKAVRARLTLIGDSLVAIAGLFGVLFGSLFDQGGTVKSRLGSALVEPASQRKILPSCGRSCPICR